MWMNVWITLEWRRTFVQMDNAKTPWRITSAFVMQASGVMSQRNSATVRTKLTIGCSRWVLFQAWVFFAWTDRHRNRQADTQAGYREIDRHSDRPTHRQTDTQKEEWTEPPGDRLITDRQTDRQIAKQSANNSLERRSLKSRSLLLLCNRKPLSLKLLLKPRRCNIYFYIFNPFCFW